MTEIERIEEDLAWLGLMIEYAEKILQAKEEMKALEKSSISQLLYLIMQDGLASNLAHVGEQLDSSKLSKETQIEFDYIPWSDIKKFRDKHDHWYQDYLPELYEQLEEIILILTDRLSDLY